MSLPADHNKKVVIDEDEYSDSDRIEYLCNNCHTNTLVTIADKTGNSDLFCKRCGVTYNTEDTVRHKSRLSVPLETETAVATTPTIGEDAVAIRHQPTLKDGAAQLAKRGTIRFTYYYDSSEH